jgi:hypothetical protein
VTNPPAASRCDQAQLVPARRTVADRLLSTVVNPVLKRLLRSPLDDLVSGSTLLLGYRGRRTGEWREVVGNYRQDGDTVMMVSQARRTWWRSLIGGQPVRLRLRGVDRTGVGGVAADGREVRIRLRLDPMAGAGPTAHGRRLLRAWFRASTLGEVLGFCVPAVVASVVVGTGGWFVEPSALVLAGAVEGAVLGLGQAYALRQALPTIRTRDWTRATAAGAAVAWLVGMAPSVIGKWLWDLSAPLAIGLGAVGATVLLGSIGGLQWLVLRGHVPHAGRWVPATAAAWTLGLAAFIAVTVPLWHEGQSAGSTTAIGVLGAVVMAAVVAAVTGLALVRLLSSTGR